MKKNNGCDKSSNKELENNLIIYELASITKLIAIEYEKIAEEDKEFYYITMDINDDINKSSSITLTDSGRRKGLYKVAKRSNRVVKLGEGKYIPIIFDTDIYHTKITDKKQVMKYENLIVFEIDNEGDVHVKYRRFFKDNK